MCYGAVIRMKVLASGLYYLDGFHNTSLLDIGCGFGLMTDYLQDEFNLSVAGTDIKNTLVKQIKFYPDIKMIEHSFQYGLLSDVLHHIEIKKQLSFIKHSFNYCDKIIVFEALDSILARLACKLGTWLAGTKVDDFDGHRKDWHGFLSGSFIVKELPLHIPIWYPFKYRCYVLEELH